MPGEENQRASILNAIVKIILHTNATKPNNQMASQTKPAARCKFKALLQQRKRNQQNGAYSIGRAKKNKMTEML